MTDASQRSNHPTGAETLIETLVNCGVDLCFTNPGTSEMHLVAAIDKVPGMRPVLGLFEGVVTGAADGYARMTGKPAATLLHLGPGLANGISNLHNAKRAGSPVVNIVGDHATSGCASGGRIQAQSGQYRHTDRACERRMGRSAHGGKALGGARSAESGK
jgi:acetolactate synthase-1/2/3 large subunit